MNAYLQAQAPLLAGFALLLVTASIWPHGKDRLTQMIAVAALALSAILVALKLEPGQEFFGGAIRVTVTGKSLAYAGLAESLVPRLHAGPGLHGSRPIQRSPSGAPARDRGEPVGRTGCR